jgi:hypothetical protein
MNHQNNFTAVYEYARYHELKRLNTKAIEQSALSRYAIVQHATITRMQTTGTLRCVW